MNTVLRLLLLPLTAVYRAGLALHGALTARRSVDIPVVSVGNITAGGTGKTPLVMNIIETLSGREKTAVVMRGYGRSAGGILAVKRSDDPRSVGDEALLIKTKFPETEVVLSADRYKGACLAREAGSGLIILDDGFQSRELERDLDIVMIDCTDPFGGGLIPSGRRREPMNALGRAGAVVFNRCSMTSPERMDYIRKTVARYNPSAQVFLADEEVDCFRSLADGSEKDASWFSGRKALCFSAIGNPAGFECLLRSVKVDIIENIRRRDHHYWKKSELDEIERLAREKGLDIITTEKDAVRISGSMTKGWKMAMKLAVKDEILWKDYINGVKSKA
ncbi:MAG: tetraacyldisaccharide 4'-kinase [Elusimicrobia bacterium]|nr:tetraacyldisaccharide 4'-kinase [Elusimicrobiota bacterium]